MTYNSTRKLFFCISTAFLAMQHTPASALDWRLRPTFSLREIYSDNIALASSNEKSALVTEVSPGLSLSGSSPISTFDLNYSLQGIYNAQGDSGLDIHNQLQMNTDYEFVRNKLFVESSSSISQQNVSNRSIASDNISGENSSSTVSTFSLSPYWTPHFKSFADGEFRVTYDRVSSKGGESSLSDSNTFSQNINLNSGRDFSLISWSASFNNSVQNNNEGESISFQDSQLELRYAIGREYSVFARGGQSSNSFASQSDSSNNGISYTFGGQWEPSQRFRLEGGYGNNRFITVEITPIINRLHWITTYTNNDIGLNTGDTWNTELNYTTRRSVWALTYTEETITTQQLLLDEQIFTTTDAFGNQITTPSSNTRSTRLPSLTDEVFVTKTAELSVSFQTGKSDLDAEIFKTIRTFELSENDEEVTGASASWNWQFSRQSSSNLSTSWQKTESDGANSFSDKRFDFSASVTRNFLARLNGSLEYRFTEQSSDDNLNNYSENRITANLSVQF